MHLRLGSIECLVETNLWGRVSLLEIISNHLSKNYWNRFWLIFSILTPKLAESLEEYIPPISSLKIQSRLQKWLNLSKDPSKSKLLILRVIEIANLLGTQKFVMMTLGYTYWEDILRQIKDSQRQFELTRHFQYNSLEYLD